MARVLGPVQRYLKNLYLDYYGVFEEVRGNARKRPLKAILYGSSIIFVLNLFKANEGLRSYTSEVLSACNRIGAVTDSLRNPVSHDYVQIVGELNGHRRLREIDLGFSTLIYKTEANPEVGLYKYNCNYLNPSMKEFFTKNFIDFGILGHWLVLESRMHNYDINEEEYKELHN